MRETSWGGYKWQIPQILLLLIIVLIPFGIMLYYSTLGYSYTDSSLNGQFIGLDNYRKALHDSNLGQSVYTTLVFIVVALPAQFFLGLVIALALSNQIRMKKYVLPFLIIPMVTADVVIGLIGALNLNSDFGMVGILLRNFGLQGAVLGDPKLALIAAILIDIWQWTPFVILIFLAALLSLPKEPFEAAKVDGAKPNQIFWRITLPLLRPFFIIIFLLRFTDAFKVFDKIFIMTGGGPGSATEVISIYAFRINFQYWNLGYGAAVVGLLYLVSYLISLGFVLITSKKPKSPVIA
jgi:multiple sugar transport system permease protein